MLTLELGRQIVLKKELQHSMIKAVAEKRCVRRKGEVKSVRFPQKQLLRGIGRSPENQAGLESYNYVASAQYLWTYASLSIQYACF